jgi:tetratricopeptide (TPR) repeat protein
MMNKDTNSTSISTREALNIFHEALKKVSMLYEKEEGLKYFQQALSMFENLYSGNHIEIAYCLNNVGATYILLGESELALKYLKQALEIFENLHSGDHPDIATCLNSIGAAYIVLLAREKELHYETEGLNYFRQALKMRKALYESSHPDIICSLSNVSTAYTILSKTQAGLDYVQQILVRQKEDLESLLEIFEMQMWLFNSEHPVSVKPVNTMKLSMENIGVIYISFLM